MKSLAILQKLGYTQIEMYLKITIISFFLILLTIGMILWINSIQIKPADKPKDSSKVEKVKVQPSFAPQ